MTLDTIHEQAIDLLVAGKKQIEVARELGLSDRTLRRWSEQPEFIRELDHQFELRGNLERDERSRSGRLRRGFHNLSVQRLMTLIDDPRTPDDVRIQCLRIGVQDQQADVRQTANQDFRDFVYQDRKNERLEKEARDHQEHLEQLKSINALKAASNFLSRIQSQPDLDEPAEAPEPDINPDKTGHSSMKLKPKAPPHPDLSTITRAVIRESFGKSPMDSFAQRQSHVRQQVNAFHSRRSRRHY